jgi:hypothetical protein
MKLYLFISFSLITCLQAAAQTNNSPYSILGIGDIEDSYFNRTSGMANTGIAYRNPRSLITNNPASLSGIDNQFFTVEMGVRGKIVQYFGTKVDPVNNQSSDFTFRRLALGTKVMKNWGSAIGLSPFSSQNYEFNSPQNILGTNGETANTYYQGNGGLYKVYWANGYELFKHLSLGITTSYLFGSLSQKSILQSGTGLTLVSTTRAINLGNLYLDYGLQYHGKVTKHWELGLGATFANRTDLTAQYTLNVAGADSSTLLHQTLRETYYTLPTSYGAGISLTKDHRLTLLADYRFQKWGELNYSGINYAIVNSSRASVGFEISKVKSSFNLLYEAMYFQAGFYYSDSYLAIYGQQLHDVGGTAGIGINAKRNPLSYSLSVQYGIRGTQTNGLIQERYLNLTFTLSYKDLWYTKGRKYID